MGRLFELSTQSSAACQHAISRSGRQMGADSERKFFKSAHTQAVIEEEAALKSLVFAQVFAASAHH